ncbi:Carcinoembryonic antigen-related cell adhesion molecule 5 [Portunus trituberculatus]|uniref:Carcinoembryonic antigen-related cell adhesion molecule 5 n=1 Tax=Portunus trituberculatus TaxID=210409 RepID=A0A5B7KDA6_PORTR|nr:Carcinoembryonic antigen-related cell adhesion molecule 5 [Portunus trituberculatus]
MPDAPTLAGLRSSYRVGEMLNVTCTAYDSRPPARLTFFMNREPVTVSIHEVSLILLGF